VRKLAILDVTIPGEAWDKFRKSRAAAASGNLAFHSVRDLPEALVAGREAHLSVYRSVAYNPAAITEAEIDEYGRCYAASARCVPASSTIARFH
jgi:hypothetical protein